MGGGGYIDGQTYMRCWDGCMAGEVMHNRHPTPVSYLCQKLRLLVSCAVGSVLRGGLEISWEIYLRLR